MLLTAFLHSYASLAWCLVVFHSSQPCFKLGSNTATRMCLRILKSKAKLCKTRHKPCAPSFCLLFVVNGFMCLSHHHHYTIQSRFQSNIWSLEWEGFHHPKPTFLNPFLFLEEKIPERISLHWLQIANVCWNYVQCLSNFVRTIKSSVSKWQDILLGNLTPNSGNFSISFDRSLI